MSANSNPPRTPTDPRCLLCRAALRIPAYPYATRCGDVTYHFGRCTCCGAHGIMPLPEEAALAAFYAPGNYHDHFYAEDHRAAHLGMVALLAKHLAPGARVLDYGCGNGDFLRVAVANGFAVEGAEFGAQAASQAASRAGVPVHDLSADVGLAFGTVWDAAHLGDVLEHLTDPASALTALVEQLRPGGLIAAQGPLELQWSLVGAAIRLNAMVKRLLGQTADFTPWHLSYADARAQRRFFARAGLVELHWQVAEDGWPYASQGGLRGVIAAVAILMARLPGLSGRLGNRFTALYRKP